MNPIIRAKLEELREASGKGVYDGEPEVRALLQAIAWGCNDIMTYDLPIQSQWKATIALSGLLDSARLLNQAYVEAGKKGA